MPPVIFVVIAVSIALRLGVFVIVSARFGQARLTCQETPNLSFNHAKRRLKP